MLTLHFVNKHIVILPNSDLCPSRKHNGPLQKCRKVCKTVLCFLVVSVASSIFIRRASIINDSFAPNAYFSFARSRGFEQYAPRLPSEGGHYIRYRYLTIRAASARVTRQAPAPRQYAPRMPSEEGHYIHYRY